MGIVYWSEDRIKRKIEMDHMKKRSQALYMALEDEDIDYFWDEKEVKLFDELWNRGTNIMDIADILQRCPDEVMILGIDRSRKGFIGRRRNGIVGKGSKK